jgi:hypothetical protein
MTSNHHAPYDLGYTRTTMAYTTGSEAGDMEQISQNYVSVRIEPSELKHLSSWRKRK